MVKPRNVEDYRSLAAKRLPRMVFDYLEGGAESEEAIRATSRHSEVFYSNHGGCWTSASATPQ